MHPSNDQRKVLAKLCMHVASISESGRRKKEKREIDGDGGRIGITKNRHKIPTVLAVTSNLVSMR